MRRYIPVAAILAVLIGLTVAVFASFVIGAL